MNPIEELHARIEWDRLEDHEWLRRAGIYLAYWKIARMFMDHKGMTREEATAKADTIFPEYGNWGPLPGA